jgi:hypothetical protein
MFSFLYSTYEYHNLKLTILTNSDVDYKGGKGTVMKREEEAVPFGIDEQ